MNQPSAQPPRRSSGMTPDQMMQTAVAGFEQRDYAGSNELLFELLARGYVTSFINFCIGRNFLYRRELFKAREWFLRALQDPEPFGWTNYELARLCEIENDGSAAAGYLAAFLRPYVAEHAAPELNPAHCETIVRIVHEFMAVNHAAALDLCTLLAAAGIRDYACELSVIEDRIALRDNAGAVGPMRALLAHFTPDTRGSLALAHLQAASGRRDLAVSTALAVGRMAESPKLKIAAGRVLLDCRVPEAAAFFDDELAPLAGQYPELGWELNDLKFRLFMLAQQAGKPGAKRGAAGLRAWLPRGRIGAHQAQAARG